MLTMEEARARVAKGAAHLDQVRPEWHNQIDIGTLTLHDPCGCIIGQLCVTRSSYIDDGMAKLHIKDAVLFGFDVSWEESDGEGRAPSIYQPLQDAWIEAIADRRLKAQHLPSACVAEGASH